MTILFAKKLVRLALITTAIVFVNGMLLQKVHARKVDLNTFCQKFPLNSRCLIDKLTVQTQVIKLRLKTSGERNEWIRIEISGNTVKLLHTTRDKSFVSDILNNLASLAPVPYLPDIFNFYNWYDHPTIGVAFESNSCILLQRLKSKKSVLTNSRISGFPSCTITGTDSVVLTTGMDIHYGQFTIVYKENNLVRSITFRIPAKN